MRRPGSNPGPSAFTDKEVADLTIVIALMNAMNRVGIGSRLAPAA
jgi:alkylhydroperoxidase family enzyme